jgi:GNAT superfamily N-acetyltransferase
VNARIATAADAVQLVRVINAAYLVEQFFVRGDRTTNADILERMAKPGALFLVVDDSAGTAPASDPGDGPALQPPRIAGTVFVQVKSDRGFFGMLSVDPARQKTGVGRRLIEAVEEYCRMAGCRFLDLDVVNLRTELPAFYRRFGFAPYDTGPFRDPEKLTRPAHLVLMTKPIVDVWA